MDCAQQIEGLSFCPRHAAARREATAFTTTLTRASCSSHGGYVMPISPTLQKYLDQNATYDLITHEPTTSSMRTAEA